MAYVPHIPAWFSTRKAAQVTAFFAARAGGAINILRATKLIYLADRNSLAQRERPITGDNFVSMPFGPVNTYTYSYMNGDVTDRAEDWAEFIGARQRHSIPLSRAVTNDDLDELSRAELRILEETWAAFRDIDDQFELAEWTHRFCPEWRDPNGSALPLEFATVFRVLEKPEPIDLAEEIQAERSLVSSLKG